MSKITKQFVTGEIVNAEDWNAIIDAINEREVLPAMSKSGKVLSDGANGLEWIDKASDIVIDGTLKLPGQAADAKATGDKITQEINARTKAVSELSTKIENNTKELKGQISGLAAMTSLKNATTNAYKDTVANTALYMYPSTMGNLYADYRDYSDGTSLFRVFKVPVPTDTTSIKFDYVIYQFTSTDVLSLYKTYSDYTKTPEIASYFADAYLSENKASVYDLKDYMAEDAALPTPGVYIYDSMYTAECKIWEADDGITVHMTFHIMHHYADGHSLFLDYTAQAGTLPFKYVAAYTNTAGSTSYPPEEILNIFNIGVYDRVAKFEDKLKAIAGHKKIIVGRAINLLAKGNTYYKPAGYNTGQHSDSAYKISKKMQEKRNISAIVINVDGVWVGENYSLSSSRNLNSFGEIPKAGIYTVQNYTWTQKSDDEYTLTVNLTYKKSVQVSRDMSSSPYIWVENGEFKCLAPIITDDLVVDGQCVYRIYQKKIESLPSYPKITKYLKYKDTAHRLLNKFKKQKNFKVLFVRKCRRRFVGNRCVRLHHRLGYYK